MIAVIASGITDPNKLRKLTEFAKENESEIKKSGNNMYVECPDLKIAKKVSQKVLSLKKEEV